MYLPLAHFFPPKIHVMLWCLLHVESGLFLVRSYVFPSFCHIYTGITPSHGLVRMEVRFQLLMLYSSTVNWLIFIGGPFKSSVWISFFFVWIFKVLIYISSRCALNLCYNFMTNNLLYSFSPIPFCIVSDG